MNLRSCFASHVVFLVALFPVPLFATDESEPSGAEFGAFAGIDPEAPGSLREALLTGPHRMARPLPGIGAQAVRFPIDTEVPEAQEFFNQGIALLHVFWYSEAERAFRTVVHLDPENPMGYWGLAMANEFRPERARVFAQAALARSGPERSEREQRWVGTLGDYYAVVESPLVDEPGVSPGAFLVERDLGRITTLEDLVLDDPEDIEALAFLVRQVTLDQYRSGLLVTPQTGVDALAERLAGAAPEHPSRHYRSFLWLERRPERALEAGLAAVQVAPNAADIWRFAAEAQMAAGRPAAAIPLLERSVAADLAYLKANRLGPAASENLAGNYAALMANLTGAGRIREALEHAQSAMALPRDLTGPGADGFAGEEASPFDAGQRWWVYAHMQAGKWEELLAGLESGQLPAIEGDPVRRAWRLTWTGLTQAVLGRREAAEATVEMLSAHQKSLEGEERWEGLAGSIEEAEAILDAALGLTAEGLGPEDAWEQAGMLASSLPPLAVASILLKAGREEEALFWLEEEMLAAPGHFLPVAWFCATAHRVGLEPAAAEQFDPGFQEMASRADVDLAVFKALNAVAKGLDLPETWALPAATDAGRVLDISSENGWEPPRAPDFELPGLDGESVRLRDGDGESVILLFVPNPASAEGREMLESFRIERESFDDAGLRTWVIGAGPAEELRERFGVMEDGWPERTLADADLAAFGVYGAYDEFEGAPRHGVAVVDADGWLLWNWTGRRPFLEARALVEEATRLRSLSLNRGGEGS